MRRASIEIEEDDVGTKAMDLADDCAWTILLADHFTTRLRQDLPHPHPHDGTEVPEQDARPAIVVHPANLRGSAEFPARAFRARSAAPSVIRAWRPSWRAGRTWARRARCRGARRGQRGSRWPRGRRAYGPPAGAFPASGGRSGSALGRRW